MDANQLAGMKLDSRYIKARIDFLESYANTNDAEYGALPGSAKANIDRTTPEPDSGWLLRMEAASCRREAAQWALFLDPARASALLDEAGRNYSELGYPYGLFLRTTAGIWTRDQDRTVLNQLMQVLTNRRQHEETEFSATLDHPQQQAYGLLACAGDDQISREFRDQLIQYASASLHRFGVTPMGALGIPIRRYWIFAEYLLRQERSLQDFNHLLQQIVAMSATYAETMESAMTNDLLWRHAASAVEPADIDIAGLTALLVRHYGVGMSSPILERQLGNMNSLSRAPIQLGLDLATQGRQQLS